MKYDERGATAIEYSLLVVLIALVVIAGVGLLGTTVANMFQTTANLLTP